MLKRLALLSLVALLTVYSALNFPVSAAAEATLITTCTLETHDYQIPGEVWLTDNDTVLHIRGQTSYDTLAPLPGHPECDPRFSSGKLVSKYDLTLNLVTGQGNVHGRVTIYPSEIDGMWVGSFHGKIRDFVMSGKSIVRGTADLKGLVMKSVIQEIAPDTFDVRGVIRDH